MVKMTQAQLLLQAFMMIVGMGACKETPIKDWVKILLFLHKKGYLYASCDNGKLNMIACMYRIPEINEKNLNEYPEEEKGRILFVPFFVSRAKDNKLANGLLKRFLVKNPDIEEICFHERGDKTKLRRFKRTKKE